MSWSLSIPTADVTPNEVAGEKVLDAIQAAEYGSPLDPNPAAQFEAAKAAATELIVGPLAGKRAYRIHLAGHADPGDQSTSADEMRVRVSEVR
jgi:hypothetical protein